MGGRWTLAVVLSLAILLPSSGSSMTDDIIPEIRERVDRMRKILLPVPDDMLDEAWYLIGSYLIPLDSETEECRNHSGILFDSYLNHELWALTMVDASSKPGSGTMNGNIMGLGNYDECIAVSAPHGKFKGQHCIVETRGILPPDLMDKVAPQVETLPEIRKDMTFSVCVPDSCTAQDVRTHMDVALNSINATAIMYNTSCSSATTPPLNPSDYFVLLILVVIVLLVILSTCYDHLTAKSEQKKMLVSFSITTNIRELLSTTLTPSSLPCLHGLRVFTMAWIILGHRAFTFLVAPVSNFASLLQELDSIAWIPLQNIKLTVEIFFLLSGTLAAYNFFRDRHKGKRFSYVSFCLHRYRRLTPPLLMVSLLYATVLIRLADGPIWRRMFTKHQQMCQGGWWINILYISNYADPSNLCIPPTWYVAVDFQLHVLCPLLLLTIHKKESRGYLLAGVVFLVSNAAFMVYAFQNDLPAGGSFKSFRTYEYASLSGHILTHTRLTSFVIGLCFGHLLFRIKQDQLKVNLSKVQLWIGWGLTALLFVGAVLITPIFDDPQYVHKPWLDTLHVVWKRPALALAAAWVIFVCTIGHGGMFDTILSWKVLIPLSRLTYCAFLVHFFLQQVQTYSSRTSLHLQYFNIWYLFLADFFASYLVATLLYLGVEAPISNVFNCLFKEPDNSKEKNHNVALSTLTIP